MPVQVFSASGSKSDIKAKLPEAVFGVEIKNHQLLKSAYLAYMANSRRNLARTLKRGEVSGGGKKPWRQKGTGRARFGSSRNPIWRGGGVAFGPTGIENYSHKLSSQQKAIALRQALSAAKTDDKLVVLSDIGLKEIKTKNMVGLLSKMGVEGSCLLVVGQIDEKLKKSTNNLQEVKLSTANNLNVFDVLNCDTLILTNAGLEGINKRLGDKK